MPFSAVASSEMSTASGDKAALAAAAAAAMVVAAVVVAQDEDLQMIEGQFPYQRCHI
jgi:hypothetical protein